MLAAGQGELVCPQAPPGQTEFLVSVPPGVVAGTAIQTATPDGQVLTFVVPDDFREGQMIPVFYTPLGRQATTEIGAEPPPAVPPPLSKVEVRTMFQTFGDAKDRWKIDGSTLKGFYLHSESRYLYCWDQLRGILYEFEQSSGQCRPVWSSAVPALNAEIWQVLPLPPTDPASLQSADAQSGRVPNVDVYLLLSIAHEAGHQLPPDVLETASAEFCCRFELEPNAQQKLRSLPPAGQFFVIQNFRGDGSEAPSKAFVSYVAKLLKRPRAPWGSSACTLVVHTAGAIIGRCCPDLDALCREDPPERLAQAHCNIRSEQDRFYVCDLNTAAEGTLLDGFPVNDTWVGPIKTGSLLSVGPLRIRIQLSDMAKSDALPSGNNSLKRPCEMDDESALWQRKVHQVTSPDEKLAALKRQQQYKDRAEMRRQMSKAEAGSVAIDGLIRKFEKVQEAEKAAEEEEENRVEMPLLEANREANIAPDGSFLGGGGFERCGLGFHSAANCELIPNVLDPRSLSAQDAIRLKTQLRYEQLQANT